MALSTSRGGTPTLLWAAVPTGLTGLWVKNFFLISNFSLLSLSLKPFLLVLSIHSYAKKVSPSPACKLLSSSEGPQWCVPRAFSSPSQSSQFPQPFFTGELLQPSDHLSGPPLDPLQELHVLLVLGVPGLDSVLQMRPRKGRGGTVLSLTLLVTPLLLHPRILLAF